MAFGVTLDPFNQSFRRSGPGLLGDARRRAMSNTEETIELFTNGRLTVYQ
jgi:hypothetical protein